MRNQLIAKLKKKKTEKCTKTGQITIIDKRNQVWKETSANLTKYTHTLVSPAILHAHIEWVIVFARLVREKTNKIQIKINQFVRWNTAEKLCYKSVARECRCMRTVNSTVLYCVLLIILSLASEMQKKKKKKKKAKTRNNNRKFLRSSQFSKTVESVPFV